ncbi:hypothetical protein T03_8801 [Trichinella britovi]|uniref:Uncharacterized protein n=1 Tax=Trichinella britovi TaxID=45882 RepID=A0A0V1CW04_TRIBR|nr:hypothetical protein T03_8801 [Trichinella britovi]
MGNWFSHHLPRPVSREGICTCRQLPGRWMVSLLFRGRDALADDPPCASTSEHSSMVRLPCCFASNAVAACRGDASLSNDATMWPSTADGSTNPSPDVGVFVYRGRSLRDGKPATCAFCASAARHIEPCAPCTPLVSDRVARSLLTIDVPLWAVFASACGRFGSLSTRASLEALPGDPWTPACLYSHLFPAVSELLRSSAVPLQSAQRPRVCPLPTGAC